MLLSHEFSQGYDFKGKGVLISQIAILMAGGNLALASFISQIVYWHLPNNEHKRDTRLRIKKDGEYWLVKTDKDWWQECYVSSGQVGTFKTKLIAQGLIKTTNKKFFGTPTTHMTLTPKFEETVKDLYEYILEYNFPSTLEECKEVYNELNLLDNSDIVKTRNRLHEKPEIDFMKNRKSTSRKTESLLYTENTDREYRQKLISFSSEKEAAGAALHGCNGLICSICGEKQFMTPSGETCKNGHGGAPGVESKIEPQVDLKELPPKKNILPKLIRIGKKPLKKIEASGLTIFNYSIEAKQILKCWNDWGGKLHVNGYAKGAPAIQRMINNLLIEGWNPYINLTDDPELRKKEWTTKEICQCIEFYVGTLKKDISGFYFDQFVVYVQRGKFGRSKPNYSILVESFQNLPKNSKWAEMLKKEFLEQFPSESIYPIVFLNIADFLEKKNDDYQISDPSNSSLLPVMFFTYMKHIVSVNGKTDQLKYMSSKQNLDSFFNGLIKSFKAKKRTKEEKEIWIKEKPLKEANIAKAKKNNRKWKKEQQEMESKGYIINNLWIDYKAGRRRVKPEKWIKPLESEKRHMDKQNYLNHLQAKSIHST